MLEAYLVHLDPKLMLYGVRHEIPTIPTLPIDFNALDASITSYDWRWEFLPQIENTDKPWRLCSGCNFLAPVEALRAVGGWDESFVTYGGDDIEVAVRLWAHGLRIKPVVAAFAYHVTHPLNKSNKGNADKVLKREAEVGLA